MTKSETLVRLENITKIYGTHKVLDSVSFDLKRGEVHCLVGENGAGKSTLIKVLSGAVTPEAGEIYINDNLIRSMNPRKAIELGISTIYQDAELVDSLTVADNVFLGSEQTGFLPFVVDKYRQFQRTKETINVLHMDLPESSLVEELSASQKQMLQIVKALYRDSKIIIMDEPTSSLGLQETEALMEIIRNLRNQGIGIVYISHYLDEIFEIGDRVTILKDGEDMGTYDISSIDVEAVIRKMVGRDASMFYSKKSVPIGDVQVEIRDMAKSGVVEEVSFSVRRGEILGVGGLVGSGRSEMVSLIFGVDKPDSGEIILNGKSVKIRSPRDAIRAGICLITEDRRKYGVLTGRNVIENTALVHNEVFRGPIIDRKSERLLTADMIDKLSISVADDDQKIEELSGGNQQKVIIGRWLLDDAVLYIFDEPTKGVDVGAKEQIYELMTHLVENGKSIIMVSSDMPELLSLSDRIAIMRDGRLVDILENSGVREEDLIRHFVGVDPKMGGTKANGKPKKTQ